MTFNTANGNNVYLPSSQVVPSFLNITDITKANPMVVTTSTSNQWIAGQAAYFNIPFDYGMYQLNGQTAIIQSVDATNLIFTFSLDSSNYDTFSVPLSGEKPATMAPAGARNTYNFITLPFHSENGNIGN